MLDRAAAAAGERAGRDLYQWRSATDLTHLRSSKVKGSLATTGAAGGTLITDVPILKAGSFHGGYVVLDASDLVAMVERFGILAPDTFVPPVRIDHSFTVLNVIGHIADLRVATLDDPSNGGKPTPYLLADLQILDDTALSLIQKGTLRNRSSEIGAYEANNGDVHSLVMWGVAFVDIPAVEGLGDIQLGKATPGLGRPHKITALTEGDPVPDDAPTDEQTSDAPEEQEQEGSAADADQPGAPEGDEAGGGEQDEAGGGAAGAGDQDADADEDDDQGEGQDEDHVGSDHDEQDAPSGNAAPPTPGTGGDSPAAADLAATRTALGLSADATPEQALRALGLTAQADALAAENRAALSAAVAGYAAKGLLGKLARPAAEALLGHHDSSVREHARTLLDNLPAPVKAGNGDHLGKTSSNATGPRGDDAPGAADLTASEDLQELGRQWFALTPAQRRDGTPEEKAYNARRRELETQGA